MITPGKWVTSLTLDKVEGVRTEHGFVCMLPKPLHYTGQDARYKAELEETADNARLIAAAPKTARERDILRADIKAIQKLYNKTIMHLCGRRPPKIFDGFKTCLSCRLSPMCRLLYKYEFGEAQN